MLAPETERISIADPISVANESRPRGLLPSIEDPSAVEADLSRSSFCFCFWRYA